MFEAMNGRSLSIKSNLIAFSRLVKPKKPIAICKVAPHFGKIVIQL